MQLLNKIRPWWWLVLLAIIGVFDWRVIVQAQLTADVAVGVVSSSFVLLSAIAAAIAATQSVEVSRQAELTARRATEALSRSLLPERFSFSISAPPDADEDSRMLLSMTTDPDVPVIVSAVTALSTTGHRTAADLDNHTNRTSEYFVTLWRFSAPRKTVAEWCVEVEIRYSDSQKLSTWIGTGSVQGFSPGPDGRPSTLGNLSTLQSVSDR